MAACPPSFDSRPELESHRRWTRIFYLGVYHHVRGQGCDKDLLLMDVMRPFLSDLLRREVEYVFGREWLILLKLISCCSATLSVGNRRFSRSLPLFQLPLLPLTQPCLDTYCLPQTNKPRSQCLLLLQRRAHTPPKRHKPTLHLRYQAQILPLPFPALRHRIT